MLALCFPALRQSAGGVLWAVPGRRMVESNVSGHMIGVAVKELYIFGQQASYRVADSSHRELRLAEIEVFNDFEVLPS